MASRRILVIISGICACLVVAALGVMVHANSGRDVRPAQRDLAHELTVDLDRVQTRLHALAAAGDIATVRETRQELARAVLEFDQNLLALGEAATGGDAGRAVRDMRETWRTLGLDLADLAAGEYAPSSAAGRETVTAFAESYPGLSGSLATVGSALRAADLRDGRVGRLARTAAMVLGGTTLLLALVADRKSVV